MTPDAEEPLVRGERADRDVISVGISQRELLSSGAGVEVGLLFEPRDESACPGQGQVEIIDTEKQEEAVARLRMIRTEQGRVLVLTPLVKAKQDSSICIKDLAPIVMARRSRG